MRLLRFKVKDFRAIRDSGFIECGQITAFVGFNEAGKTTLLAALMKLVDQKYRFTNVNAKTYKIDAVKPFSRLNALLEDVPIERQEEIMKNVAGTVFVEAEFTMDDELNNSLLKLNPAYKPVNTLYITKTYGGIYDFPDIFKQFAAFNKQKVIDLVLSKLPSFMYFKEVTEIRSEIDLVELAQKLSGSKKVKQLTQRETVFANLLSYLDIWQSNLIKSIKQIYGSFDEMAENDVSVDFEEIFRQIPMFKDRFTRGFDNLTKEFRKWWGNADLNIFYEVYKRGIRIKMTDERGESFLLENRSTGFRRFFALFLAFSVTAKEDFENAILLFDEAGAALHPKMQRKLINFFGALGKNSQIMYNTHTAYMLPIKEMNRVRIAYKDKDGQVFVTSDMSMDIDKSKEESLFVAEASLAMYLAQTALVGSLPIVTLKAEDMYYLQIIRNVLIARGKLNTVHETLIFAAGENGIDSVAQIFSANDNLPVVILPSDPESRLIKKRLLSGTYKNEPSKVYEITDFIDEAQTFVELIPTSFIKLFAAEYFAEILGEAFKYDDKKPLYQQIESYARLNKITLPEKYPTYLAKNMKMSTMINYKNKMRINGKLLKGWRRILKRLVKLDG